MAQHQFDQVLPQGNVKVTNCAKSVTLSVDPWSGSAQRMS